MQMQACSNDCHDEHDTPGWREFMSCLRWLEAEGYIEMFYNDKGEEMVRIAEGAEEAVL
jgi:hypothetical protein